MKTRDLTIVMALPDTFDPEDYDATITDYILDTASQLIADVEGAVIVGEPVWTGMHSHLPNGSTWSVSVAVPDDFEPPA